MTTFNILTQSQEDVAFAVVRDVFGLESNVKLGWAKQWMKATGECRDWTGKYVVSSTGRVFDVSDKVREMSVGCDGCGYSHVHPYYQGKQLTVKVHRLVASTFLGKPKDGEEVAHSDGNRTNSNLSNLRYCSKKENHGDKKRHGTSQAGESHGQAKLSNEQAQQLIYEYDAGGATHQQLAVKYGVVKSTVTHIINGYKYANLHRPNLQPPTTKLLVKMNEVVTLYENAGHTFKEVGQVLGTSGAMATMLYNRAVAHGLTKGT